MAIHLLGFPSSTWLLSSRLVETETEMEMEICGARDGEKDGTGAAYRVMYWAVSSGGGGSQVISIK